MKVRAAAVDDADEIGRIQVPRRQQVYRGLVADADLDALPDDERAAMWQRRIESGVTTALVADDGLRRGGIRIGPSRDADALSAAGEVSALYVRPASWNREAAPRVVLRGRLERDRSDKRGSDIPAHFGLRIDVRSYGRTGSGRRVLIQRRARTANLRTMCA